MVTKTLLSLVTVLSTAMLTGCASSTPPLQDMKIAKMALIDAQEASENPEASDYFHRAESALQKARKRMAEKSYDEAKFLAQKATADARLAKIKAQNAELQKRIEALESELRRMREEFVTIDGRGGAE